LPEYHSPNQEPASNRMMLVILFTFLFLIGFQFIYSKYGPKKAAAPVQQQAQQQQAAPIAPAASVPTMPKPPAASAAATKQASAEGETVIENDLYKITFTNRGAQVKSWILKKFTDDKRQPLDLVNAAAAQQYGYPLSLFSYDQGLKDKLNSALYVASAQGTQHAPADITFEYAEGNLSVRKTFHFDDSYVVKTDIEVAQNGAGVQAFPSWPSGFGDTASAASFASGSIDWDSGNKIERQPFKKVSGGATVYGPLAWAGPVDQYFAAIFLPDNPSNAALVTHRNQLRIPKNPDKPDPNDVVAVDVLGGAVGNLDGHTRERVFVGPKALDVLASVHPVLAPGQTETTDLRPLIDFGWFSFISRPLFAALRWTHHHIVPNWGWAIIVLTAVINLALLPLRITSMKSALKTQKIQPQINAIKDKYKKYSMRDPRRQEMNQEIAALMKTEGVNPAGGCLPLLIQFPFLVAFYRLLGNTIELRHASFLYLQDLSAPDPYHIMPVLIIISTFVVQKMTPTGGMDPQQQKVMNLMMPVMLGVISWNLSSGLCLYWVVGNIIAMLMQLVMNRTGMGQEMRQIAEKRARKQALKKA